MVVIYGAIFHFPESDRFFFMYLDLKIVEKEDKESSTANTDKAPAVGPVEKVFLVSVPEENFLVFCVILDLDYKGEGAADGKRSFYDGSFVSYTSDASSVCFSATAAGWTEERLVPRDSIRHSPPTAAEHVAQCFHISAAVAKAPSVAAIAVR